MMCLAELELGTLLVSEPVLVLSGMSPLGDMGPLDSDTSDGDGVLGGVSMDGIGWSLKQADS